jgi:hypothetical protein
VKEDEIMCKSTNRNGLSLSAIDALTVLFWAHEVDITRLTTLLVVSTTHTYEVTRELALQGYAVSQDGAWRITSEGRALFHALAHRADCGAAKGRPVPGLPIARGQEARERVGAMVRRRLKAMAA